MIKEIEHLEILLKKIPVFSSDNFFIFTIDDIYDINNLIKKYGIKEVTTYFKSNKDENDKWLKWIVKKKCSCCNKTIFFKLTKNDILKFNNCILQDVCNDCLIVNKKSKKLEFKHERIRKVFESRAKLNSIEGIKLEITKAIEVENYELAAASLKKLIDGK